MQTQTLTNPRRWDRRPASMEIRLVLDPHYFKVDDSATILDISLGGAGVRTKFPVVPGERVGVVIKGELPHAIPARAVWVREDESTKWVYVGLEFLDT